MGCIMKGKRAFNSTAVYILLGIILAFLINQGMALGLSTGMPIVAVESNSMVPTFYKGDILMLQGVPPDRLKVGDIIVFSPKGSAYSGIGGFLSSSPITTPIVHRIVKINEDGSFQTKGDANPGQLPFEKSIDAGQIHGRSIFIIPYLGWVKIGITEYVIPNAIWIAIAAIAAFAVAKTLPKRIKTQVTTFMR